MKIHHLNCGTMRPLMSDTFVCHVLLVETDNGLVLVDTGIGNGDIDDPDRRLGAVRRVVRPDLAREETAAHQVVELGYQLDDVRHIVATHLDLDHVGGVTDFPHAVVHTTIDEQKVARSGGPISRLRYRRDQLPPSTHITAHAPTTDSWRGFDGVTVLEEISEGIVLVPLAGHTRGHEAVAIDAGDHWVLHCGDAFYHHGTIDGSGSVPLTVTAAEWMFAQRPASIPGNHRKLSELYQRGAEDLQMVCAHDPVMLARAQEQQLSRE